MINVSTINICNMKQISKVTMFVYNLYIYIYILNNRLI